MFVSKKLPAHSLHGEFFFDSIGSASLYILVPIMFRLVRAFHRHADVVGLGLGEGRQVNTQLFEVQACYHFVEDLRERVHDAAFVLDASDSLLARIFRSSIRFFLAKAFFL